MKTLLIYWILLYDLFGSSYQFQDISNSGYSLTINTNPYNSKVVIKNSSYRYYDGVELPKGHYIIEISKQGYKTKVGDVYLDKHTVLNITLTKQNTQNIHISSNLSSKVWFDKDTNLTWQNTKNSKKYTYAEAKQYCQNLSLNGFSNWRLPSVDELNTLFTDIRYKDKNNYKHFIKKVFLNNLPNDRKSTFWSISNYEDFDTKAMVVRFYLGNNKPENKTKKHFVKCVW